MKHLITIVGFFTFYLISAQDQNTTELPYAEIPEYPETYTAGSVVSRMIDGLGFRYYWATEGLRESDLTYRPVKDSRSMDETLDHILEVSWYILNGALKQPNDFSQSREETLNFAEKRSKTLHNLRKASLIFLESSDLEDYPVIFKNSDGESIFPFWNQINGPIADALWHCGQVVSLRRQSGNPLPTGVNVFLGNRQNQ